MPPQCLTRVSHAYTLRCNTPSYDTYIIMIRTNSHTPRT